MGGKGGFQDWGNCHRKTKVGGFGGGGGGRKKGNQIEDSEQKK